jgi:hypothetical protein
MVPAGRPGRASEPPDQGADTPVPVPVRVPVPDKFVRGQGRGVRPRFARGRGRSPTGPRRPFVRNRGLRVSPVPAVPDSDLLKSGTSGWLMVLDFGRVINLT